MYSVSSALLLLSASLSVRALTSSLQQITANVGSNPTNVGLYYYKPTTVVANPPLVVAMHECTASAQVYYSQTNLPTLADQYGFIIIYPSAPTAGGCWDVASNASLTHNLGGDSLGIANAARWAVSGSGWGVDASRVFATGTSSGAMMTNVMMGAYPDVFAAGSLYSGVPDACFEGPSAWNTQCAEGQLILTPEEWADRVYAAYPGYTGKRPPVQFWHGTADTTLYPQNFYEEIKQWTQVFNVSQTPTSNLTNNPQAGYSRATFGPNVQGILAQGVGHTVPEHETDTLTWFGIIGGVVGAGGGSTSTTGTITSTSSVSSGTSTVSTSTSTSSGATQTEYGQCGGVGWTGATACASPYTCQVLNSYYSQCL